MLLVLGGRRLTRLTHLHLHGAGQEQLLLLLLRVTTILLLEGVDSVAAGLSIRHDLLLLLLLGPRASYRCLVVGSARRGSLRWLLMVVLVQLVNVQTSTALLHVYIGGPLPIHRALDLNRLRAVALLSVQLTTIHRLDMHDLAVTADRVRA